MPLAQATRVHDESRVHFACIRLFWIPFVPPSPPPSPLGSYNSGCLPNNSAHDTRRFHKIEVMANGNETFPTWRIVILPPHDPIWTSHHTHRASFVCPCVTFRVAFSVSSGEAFLFGVSTYVLIYRFRNLVDLPPRRHDSALPLKRARNELPTLKR